MRHALSMFVAACLLCGVGCVFNSHREEVIGGDASRQPVTFESPQSLQQFTREVSGRYPSARRQGHDSFAIPFVIGASTTKVLSENAFYNSQVEKADVDANGALSDAEVEAYCKVK